MAVDAARDHMTSHGMASYGRHTVTWQLARPLACSTVPFCVTELVSFGWSGVGQHGRASMQHVSSRQWLRMFDATRLPGGAAGPPSRVQAAHPLPCQMAGRWLSSAGWRAKMSCMGLCVQLHATRVHGLYLLPSIALHQLCNCLFFWGGRGGRGVRRAPPCRRLCQHACPSSIYGGPPLPIERQSINNIKATNATAIYCTVTTRCEWPAVAVVN